MKERGIDMKKNSVVMVLVFALSVLTFVFAGAVFSAQTEPPTGFDEAYGASSGVALYNVQVVLGITADAIAGKVYNNDEAKGIINEQKTMLGVMDEYSRKLQKNPSISKYDVDTLKDISTCIGRLKITADSLMSYLANPTSAAANDFEAKRKSSYAAIAKLLGIDKDKK